MGYVLTAKGREINQNRLKGTGTEPVNAAWGLNPNTLTAATTDVALFKPAAEARVAGTSSIVTGTTTNDTYQVAATITSSSTQTIAEMGLFDNTTAPFSATWATAPTGTGGTTGTLAASYTPANNTYIQCRGEVMQVTAGTGTTSVTVSRGQNGSTAVTQSNGDQVTAGNPPGAAQTVTGGSMFIHGDHSGNGLVNGDSITYTITYKLT